MNTEKLWTEKDDVFEGTPCTYYSWPRDRLIYLTIANRCHIGDTDITQVPTFSLREMTKDRETETLENVIRDSIQAAVELDKASKEKLHAHVFKINDLSDHYGIMIDKSKGEVTLDFWEDAEDKTLAKLKKWSKEKNTSD